MKIAVDAMGGDFAPATIIDGAIRALQEENDMSVYLLGDAIQIKKELKKINYNWPNLTIIPTTEIVHMEDTPSQVFKKKPDSSIVVGIRMIKEGRCDAFVSAGSTGAILSTALLLLGRIKGVLRPALGVFFPVKPTGILLCDVGANVDVKPDHLLQFAIMASEYMKHIQGVKNPIVGLLNIGIEPNKGQDVYIKAHQLLTDNLPSFIGNIEARYLLDGKADVIICDGFIGNILVKFAEGWINHVNYEILRELMKKTSLESDRTLITNIFSEVIREYDYEEYGGVPLLGVNGVCIICHGSSGPRAIKNAILAAKKSVEESLVDSIRDDISFNLTATETLL
ncbi:MAG: phosphate acyltransferase PlsX [Candidatus Marinimicrobia bacterium]|nr:phosphate acyltransferase PlsX [Candidatus Neomarinimicrobiota bacterium]MCH8068241.1 phosphate acyltransferase PlsX [Candidatus Neomarinimicrobiota bacterium]